MLSQPVGLPGLCRMTFYLPNTSVQPTGFEAAEYLDLPAMADAPAGAVPTEDAAVEGDDETPARPR